MDGVDEVNLSTHAFTPRRIVHVTLMSEAFVLFPSRVAHVTSMSCRFLKSWIYVLSARSNRPVMRAEVHIQDYQKKYIR